MSKRSKSLLLVSEDQRRIARWSTFLGHFDVKLMIAPSAELAKQFFEAIQVDIAIVDDTCWHVSHGLRRNQNDVYLIHVADRTVDTDNADFTMFAPVDLYVLEDALVRRTEVRRTTEDAAEVEPTRERERATVQ